MTDQAPSGNPQNDELFLSAVASLRESECYWKMPLEYALGHPVELVVDFDSLGGQFPRVQPFVQQGVSCTLEAISRVGVDPVCGGPLRERVRQVVITAVEAGGDCRVDLADGVLTARVPLSEKPADPTNQIDAEIRRALGYSSSPAAGSIPEHEADEALDEPQGDPYERAEQYMVRLEAAMRNVGIWPGDKPDGPLEVKGAFGCENMAFAQWLAWVLISRVRDIIAQRGEFPHGSSTAAYAIREFDGMPGEEEVHAVLYAFDEFIRNQKR